MRLVFDKEKSSSVSKHYYLDYACILNGLVDVLEKSSATAEIIAKHNDGKTLKFLLRNIFFLMSFYIDGKSGNQITLRNMQSYNS